MCYVIENINNYTSSESVTVIVEKNEAMEIDTTVQFLKVRMTSNHDYLGATHRMWGGFMPFKMIIPFGRLKTPKITIVETVRRPLKCKTHLT